MKLFENGVGRPSNEIKKKRKIFIASIVATIVIVLIIGGIILFGKVDILNLQGKVKRNRHDGDSLMKLDRFKEYLKVSGCDVTIPIRITSTTKDVLTITDIYITYNGWDKNLESNLAHAKQSNNKLPGKSRTEDYLHVDLAKMNAKGTYDIVIYFQRPNGKKYYKNEKLKVTNNKLINDNAIKNCKNGWKKIGGSWYYGSNNKNLTGWQKLEWSGEKSWFYFNKSGKMLTGWQKLKWSGGTNWFYFDSKGRMATGWKKLKWTSGTDWFYFDPTSGYMYENKCEKIDGVDYCFNKNGIYSKKSVGSTNSVNLVCPEYALVKEVFYCYTDSTDITISIPETNIAKGLNKAFTTTNYDKKKRLQYKGTGTMTVSAKDLNGNLVAEKYVRITNSYAPSTLTLNCPSSANINEEIVCFTNQPGAKIRLSSNGSKLAGGYATSKYSKNVDKWKSFKFTKKGTVKVSVSKSGYKTVTNTITVK